MPDIVLWPGQPTLPLILTLRDPTVVAVGTSLPASWRLRSAVGSSRPGSWRLLAAVPTAGGSAGGRPLYIPRRKRPPSARPVPVGQTLTLEWRIDSIDARFYAENFGVLIREIDADLADVLELTMASEPRQ